MSTIYTLIMSDSIEHLFESWPIVAEPMAERSPIYPAASYVPAQHAPATITQYQTVAPTPVMEMAKWINIVEKGMKKKRLEPPQSILTEPLQQSALARNESMLHEVDPITTRRNVDMIQDVSTNVTRHIDPRSVEAVMQKTQEAFDSINTIPQWKEIDPLTGKPVINERDDQKPSKEGSNLAGWTILQE
jgi:hypothetical protein